MLFVYLRTPEHRKRKGSDFDRSVNAKQKPQKQGPQNIKTFS